MLIALVTLSFACQDPAPQRLADHSGQDALHYALALRVDLAHEQLAGTVDYTVAARAPLDAIHLHARHSDRWHVAFTTVDGRELASAWHDDGVVLTLPQPLATGEQVRFRATLLGTPVEGFYFADNVYGERMAFTDHYAIRARGWLPCVDDPADRARFALHLLYPKDDEACAFGVSVPAPKGAAPAPDGFRTLDTDSDVEIPPYMWAMVVGPLARVHEDGDPRLQDHLVYRQDVERAKAMLTHDAAWLHAMERTFGSYPFGKYMTVQCPTRWGGFEAPGNVQLAEGLFADARSGTGTLAHELVHMWFGDAVGYAEWREVWLSEGFASYFGPWLLAQTGGPDLRDSMARLRSAWLHSPEGRQKCVRDDRFSEPIEALNRNTYNKGAWVLHMLRGELGDDAFFAALRAYYGSCRNRAVTTADFTAAVEQSTGQRLGWFFDQWLDRAGCPELEVHATDGGIAIAQVQQGEPYRFWLRLGWNDKGSVPQQRRVRVETAEQRVDVEGPIDSLVVDPDVELLFRAH